MNLPRVESLSLSEVRAAVKGRLPAEFGFGWHIGEPLGEDFRIIAEDLLSWFKPEQGWILRVFHLRLNPDQTDDLERDYPKRQFGTPIEIIPDELLMMFGFSAQKPPIERRWRDRSEGSLDLKKVFNPVSPPKKLIVTSEAGVMGTTSFGPLFKRSIALDTDYPRVPYFFEDMAEVYRTTGIEQALFTNANSLADRSPATYMSVEIRARDLLDEARDRKNETRRFSDRLERRFRLPQ